MRHSRVVVSCMFSSPRDLGLSPYLNGSLNTAYEFGAEPLGHGRGKQGDTNV